MGSAASNQPPGAQSRKKPASSTTADSGRRPRSHGSSHIDLITLQWQHERNDLDLSNFLLAIYFMRLGTLVERSFDRMCQRHWGIKGSDMRVLLALRRGGPPYAKRPTDLYRALIVTSGAITKKIDRLASHGMVDRKVDPGHAGGFIVHLTKKGLETVEQAVEKLANESSIAPAMAQFSKEEVASGKEFCLRTLALMEELVLPGLDDEDEGGASRSTSGTSGRRTTRAR